MEAKNMISIYWLYHYVSRWNDVTVSFYILSETNVYAESDENKRKYH